MFLNFDLEIFCKYLDKFKENIKMSNRTNSVILRLERAKLPKSDFKLSNQSIINILKSGSKTEEKIEFQTQHFPPLSVSIKIKIFQKIYC